MNYYEDLLKVPQDSEQKLIEFVLESITAYKKSPMYTEAVTAYEYFKKRNVTITQFRKLLYTMSGEVVPDNFSANYKFTNAFFPKFVKQENAFLLGNGVTFNNNSTKEKLGGDDFDGAIFDAGEFALWGGVSYVFFNYDHVDTFRVTEFAPLTGTEDGALHAGIRFWQIDTKHPLRATLYQEDGFTEFIWENGTGRILKPKQAYRQIVTISVVDGEQIRDGENYPSFPIVPLWGNKEHQTELTGLREKIDGYDLIQSGFANDLDEASQIYWILQNAEGMDETDIAAFLDQLRRVRAAVVSENGATAEAHTLDVPYAARKECLTSLRDSLYADAMALDTDKITAGSITATAINSAYENLELKCDGFETCVTKCIKALLALIGVDDAPTYHRRKTTNQPEITQMVLSAGNYLDDETILKHLPFLNIDEVEDILKRKDAEEADRYAMFEEQTQEQELEDEAGQSEDGN